MVKYMVISNNNIKIENRVSEDLNYDEINLNLDSPCNLSIFDKVTSTNELLKKEKLSATPRIIVANQQTKGKGRLGRSFESPSETGIYFSYGFRPMFGNEYISLITPLAAVATCKSIEKVCNIYPGIKWVNDIFYKKKKICGILTEALPSKDGSGIEGIIIGIGINCFPGNFSPSTKSIAGCISNTPNSFSRNKLVSELIKNLHLELSSLGDSNLISEYRKRCFILGKNIRIYSGYEKDKNSFSGTLAKALDIDNSGGLIIEYLEGDKKSDIEVLQSGEVSISL